MIQCIWIGATRRAILLRLMDGDASVSELGAPFAMIFAGKADPAHRLFPQIKIGHLIGNPAAVPDSQLWGAITS